MFPANGAAPCPLDSRGRGLTIPSRRCLAGAPVKPPLMSNVKPLSQPPRLLDSCEGALMPRILAFIILLASPSVAFASDPSGLIGLLYGALALVFSVVFGITWILTRFISKRWLRTSIRMAVILFFWTPIPLGGAGYWWPAPFALLSI